MVAVRPQLVQPRRRRESHGLLQRRAIPGASSTTAPPSTPDHRRRLLLSEILAGLRSGAAGRTLPRTCRGPTQARKISPVDLAPRANARRYGSARDTMPVHIPRRHGSVSGLQRPAARPALNLIPPPALTRLAPTAGARRSLASPRLRVRPGTVRLANPPPCQVAARRTESPRADVSRPAPDARRVGDGVYRPAPARRLSSLPPFAPRLRHAAPASCAHGMHPNRVRLRAAVGDGTEHVQDGSAARRRTTPQPRAALNARALDASRGDHVWILDADASTHPGAGGTSAAGAQTDPAGRAVVRRPGASASMPAAGSVVFGRAFQPCAVSRADRLFRDSGVTYPSPRHRWRLPASMRVWAGLG